jgi:hypothetical protein
MAKILNTYRNFSAAAILARASDTCDLAVVGVTVECTNVKMSKVKNVIGASTYNLADLCKHANINHWSGFGPTIRTEVGGVLVNSDPTNNYMMGSFAGYNHSALTPCFNNTAHLDDIWVNSGETAQFIADITIGEARYVDGDIFNHQSTVEGVCLTAWEGANLAGFGYSENTLRNSSDSVSLTCNIANCTIQKTYDFKIYLTDSETVFNQNGDDIIAQWSELPNYQATVKIKEATELTVYPDSFTVTGQAFNNTTGYCSFTDAYDNANSYSNLHIYAQLFDWTMTQVGTTIDIYNAAYTAGTHLGANSAKPNGAPIADYGYHYRIYFELSM